VLVHDEDVKFVDLEQKSQFTHPEGLVKNGFGRKFLVAVIICINTLVLGGIQLFYYFGRDIII
jgi:hypothetical protein